MSCCQWHDCVPCIFERIPKEPTAMAPSTVNFQVVAPPECKYSVWTKFSADVDLEGRVPRILPLRYILKELTALSHPRSISRCLPHQELYANVVLSCGTNMFQGMVERMSFELTAFVHIITVGVIRSIAPKCFFFFSQVSLPCRQ